MQAMNKVGIVSVVISFIVIAIAYTLTYDDDTTLEFYWTPATGDVDHYDVYVSTNGWEYVMVGNTTDVPTVTNPYPLPLVAEHGSTYTVKVQAVDSHGNTGLMSEPSEPVQVILYESKGAGMSPIPHGELK